jgi:peroxiredoxin
MPVTIGQPAPDFTLFSSDKTQVSLHDYRGKKVVLLFFPLAFTSTCTAELCNVRDNISQYNNANAAVFGISTDSLFTLAKFKTEQGLNFTLLSDFNKEAATAYDTLYETFPAFGMKGVCKRSAYVIDSKGNLVYVEVCPTPGDVPDFKAIAEAVANAE